MDNLWRTKSKSRTCLIIFLGEASGYRAWPTARRLVHRLGHSFRLRDKSLPGTPDLVFPRLKKIIKVHGCFWHMHSCQKHRKDPVNNAAYWQRKCHGNALRDRRTRLALRKAGWRVLTIWECQTRDRAKIERRLSLFLAKL